MHVWLTKYKKIVGSAYANTAASQESARKVVVRQSGGHDVLVAA